MKTKCKQNQSILKVKVLYRVYKTKQIYSSYAKIDLDQ